MRVAITGATGFVGRALVRAVRDAGHEPVAVCRTPSKAADLGVEVRGADLRDRDAMVAAFADCDAVIANAALVPGHGKPSEEEFLADNVTGAENHLAGVQVNGVARLIWISTVAVYQTRLYVAQDENSPKIDPDHPSWDWNNVTTHPMYARSKAMAERSVWAFAEANSVALTVFRPGPIYGPGDDKLTRRYAEKLCKPVITGTTVAASHVHVEDVALAAATSLSTPASEGKAYNLAGPAVSPYAFLKAWRDALGWSKPVIPVPIPLTVQFDDSAAQRDLGMRMRTPAEAMPGLCQAFFDEHGALR